MIMSCRLQNLLMDYKERVNGIPVILKAVMKPFIGQVEDALTPGLMQLSWTSLNINKCTYNSRRRSVNFHANFRKNTPSIQVKGL